MMRTAVFSDIHGNLEALETAIAYLDQCEVDRVAVLGDTVGYGANPNECFEWAVESAAFCLMGNHEKAVVDPGLRDEFTPHALQAILWTERVLAPRLKTIIPELPYVRLESSATFVHASLDEPEEFYYITSLAEAVRCSRLMKTPLCFVGHTHIPSVFCEKTGLAEHLEPGVFRLDEGVETILNPGSIGQPRDGDPRLSFGIYDHSARAFEVVRLRYDNKKAAEKIYKAGLPRFLGDRLL